jgi:hypothetical protein
MNKITSLQHLSTKAICDDWMLFADSSFTERAVNIVGSYVVYGGNGNTTRIAHYDPSTRRIATESGSVYQLGKVDKAFAMARPALLKELGWPEHSVAQVTIPPAAPFPYVAPKEAKIYPKHGQVYTYEEIQKLYLRDSPNLGFDLNGRKQCLQDSMASPEEIIKKSPRIAGSKWVFVKETFEWIPVFRYADERPITEIIARHREGNEYVFIFDGFPR